MASALSLQLITLIALALVCPSSGNAFLKRQGGPNVSTQIVDTSTIELKFMEEVRGFTGKGPVDLQLPAIRKALEPMWLALPKNKQNKLGNAQVRYALHRYFVQRHGWHIDGLDRVGLDFSDQDAISRQQVPAFLMDVFAEAFGQTGLMLHELAIFAATLEHMIHNEATERLKDVYKVLDMSTDERLSVAQVRATMKAYMVSLMQGQDVLADREQLRTATRRLERTYPGWDDAQMWMDDVRETVAYFDQGTTVNPFVTIEGSPFGQVERTVQKVSERLGRFQDAECRDLKDQLLEHEEKDSGRVLLSEFYRRGMDTGMQFVEKPEFLRQLGALDETKPGEPRVIIPNYMLSQGNCLADMGFYSVCCINECEALLAHLEKDVAAPEASPERIAAIVSNISSSTVEAPRALPQKMITRLEEVAARNWGKVPLHGRLFAQWLHFLFPRECPYPHAAGTHDPLTPSEWQESRSESPVMKRQDREQYMLNAVEIVAPPGESSVDSDSEEEDDVEVMRWSDEEEILYLPTETPKSMQAGLVASFFALVVCGCILMAAVDLAKRSGALQGCLGKSEKAHVV